MHGAIATTVLEQLMLGHERERERERAQRRERAGAKASKAQPLQEAPK